MGAQVLESLHLMGCDGNIGRLGKTLYVDRSARICSWEDQQSFAVLMINLEYAYDECSYPGCNLLFVLLNMNHPIWS